MEEFATKGSNCGRGERNPLCCGERKSSVFGRHEPIETLDEEREREGRRERESVQRRFMSVGCSRVITKKTKGTWRCVSRLIRSGL